LACPDKSVHISDVPLIRFQQKKTNNTTTRYLWRKFLWYLNNKHHFWL